MGYEDIFGNIKISTARRKVEQGPFGMMMGFENCKFFIASNDGWVGLRFVKYVDIDDDVSEYPDFVLF